MTTQVASYIVTSYRHVRATPNYTEFANGDWSPSGHLDVGPVGFSYPHGLNEAVRVLTLRLVASDAKWAALYFFEASDYEVLLDRGPGRDTLCGTIYLQGDPKHLVVWLPLSDFADMYHVLQTEKPGLGRLGGVVVPDPDNGWHRRIRAPHWYGGAGRRTGGRPLPAYHDLPEADSSTGLGRGSGPPAARYAAPFAQANAGRWIGLLRGCR